MKLQFTGAAYTVTGSRTILHHNGSKYLIDCGLFQGPHEIRQRNWEPFPDAAEIKAVILTHAHIDHSGYIPKLIKDGFKGPIYCSQGTADLAAIMLPDSGYLQEEDARFANMKRISRHAPALPLYTEKDAVHSLEYFTPRPIDTWIELERGLSFRLIRAGHILGSTFVQFSYSSGNGSKLLTFSGDIGNGQSRIIRDPEQITESDILVLESTYGDRVQKRGNELEVMAQIIDRVIGRGGTLVIPAFAVGRTQEILYMISLLERQNKIKPCDVYLDSPMALDATDVYLKHSEELKKEWLHGETSPTLCSSRFKAVRTTDESMMLCMNDEPKIVISAAGMLTGGRVLHHLRVKLPYEKNGVLFVGYQVEGTKGFLLKGGLTTINIHKQKVDVEAEVFSMDSMSAHADSNDLMNWVKGFKQLPKKIILNHGEKSALEALAYRLRHELGMEVVIPQHQETVVLD